MKSLCYTLLRLQQKCRTVNFHTLAASVNKRALTFEHFNSHHGRLAIFEQGPLHDPTKGPLAQQGAEFHIVWVYLPLVGNYTSPEVTKG